MKRLRFSSTMDRLALSCTEPGVRLDLVTYQGVYATRSQLRRLRDPVAFTICLVQTREPAVASNFLSRSDRNRGSAHFYEIISVFCVAQRPPRRLCSYRAGTDSQKIETNTNLRFVALLDDRR